MNKLRCYLAGAIQDSSDSGEGWRENITPKLEEIGIHVFNPNKLEKVDLHHNASYVQKQLTNYIMGENWSKFDSIMKTIQRRDFRAIKMIDFLIVYLDPDVKYGGTVAEIEKARDSHIPIFAVCEKDLHKENFWVIYTIRDSDGFIFKSFDELLIGIKKRIESGEF